MIEHCQLLTPHTMLKVVQQSNDNFLFLQKEINTMRRRNRENSNKRKNNFHDLWLKGKVLIRTKTSNNSFDVHIRLLWFRIRLRLPQSLDRTINQLVQPQRNWLKCAQLRAHVHVCACARATVQKNLASKSSALFSSSAPSFNMFQFEPDTPRTKTIARRQMHDCI